MVYVMAKEICWHNIQLMLLVVLSLFSKDTTCKNWSFQYLKHQTGQKPFINSTYLQHNTLVKVISPAVAISPDFVGHLQG